MAQVQIIPIKKVYSDRGKGNQFYPETHINAVVDDTGTSMLTRLEQVYESIDALEDISEENEKAIAAALNDLNDRLNRINKE